MRCEKLRGLLDLHLDDQLPDELMQQIERHLLRCPACAFEARTLEQTRGMLRAALPPAETAPDFRERALARLLDAFANHLQPAPEADTPRQRILPLIPDP